MAVYQQSNYGIRETGTTTSVPNNDIARCMYYLKCVCSVIDCNDANILRYTNYNNYWILSDSEDEIVYKLCLTLSPDEFEDKVFFESDAMCGSSGNNFFEISQVQNRLGVVGSILIAGRTRRVTSIMTYKMSWMRTNYFGPMSRLADRFNPERRLIRALQETDCTIS
ncbi:unnamed protein product [Adineta steineri]|uniref:Uncharacterized protein n=1 Tax=Adineta steineri TaxID=433720 RepID=A0A815NYJ4_9BILA|nr:unnamed protein product [Adineta steineri]CAF1415785.1 unnamed protein product [Adineta steineri]CAF1437129.1 unnamed protein product [Adineta steineri]